MKRSGTIGLALLIACGGGGDDDDDIPDTVLSGVVGGDAWTFAQGQVNFVGQATGDFHVGLFGETYDECGQSGATEFLLTSFAPEPAEIPFDLQNNLTFVNDEGGPVNKVATDGLLVIEAVTETTVTGRLRARFDADNDVAGTFEIATCIVPTAPLTFEACTFDTPPPISDGDPPAVQGVAALPGGGIAMIDTTGSVLLYAPSGAGTGCDFALADTITLPDEAEAVDVDATGFLYIHTFDRLYRYEGMNQTLECGLVSAADGIAVTADGSLAYTTFVNSVDRVDIGAADCTPAVWTPGNAFSFVHGIAVIDGEIHVGGQINGEVQVLVFDDAGAEQRRYGAGTELTRAAGLGRCGADDCVLNGSWIAVYDSAGDLRGTTNIADVVSLPAGFLATDLAFPPGGGDGYLALSAQQPGTFDVEAAIIRVSPQ